MIALFTDGATSLDLNLCPSAGYASPLLEGG